MCTIVECLFFRLRFQLAKIEMQGRLLFRGECVEVSTTEYK